jgi:hypothetical protein
VILTNGSASTNLTVDDSADHSAPTFTVSTLGVNLTDFEMSTHQWGQITGLPTGASINYEYIDTPSLTLNTGPGATVEVLATWHTLDLVGNGPTTVNLGNQGNVQGLNGDLYIENTVPRATSVYVNDQADGTNLPNVLLATYQDPSTGSVYESISNLALGATIYANGMAMSSLMLSGGTPTSGGSGTPISGGNTYNVNSTVLNVPITLTAGYAGDTVNILGNSGPVTVDRNREPETVNFGNAGFVSGVNGGITIDPGFVSLTVDDAADNAPRTLTVTNQGLDNGLNPGALGSPWIAYSQLSSLLIKGGTPPAASGLPPTGNTFNVQSTLFTFGGATTIETGGGTNFVNVQSTTGRLNVQGNGGADTVTLGSLAPTLGGSMANIPFVDVTNPGGSTTLILDDEGDTAPRTPTVSGSSITNLGANPLFILGNPVNSQTIQYTPAQVTSIFVYAGSGGNTFAVEGTGSGTSTTLVIGGAGQATLDASHATSENILIGGRTDWDTNLAALEAIMAEWDRTDLGFTDRRSDLLNGTNGQGKAPLNIVDGQLILLKPATNPASSNGTVHANAYIDKLIGGNAIDPATSKRLHNWFFYTSNENNLLWNYLNTSDKKDHIT